MQRTNDQHDAPRLSLRHVSKSFGAVAAVEDISFDAHAGRVTGFIGRNGAGKTTTLRLLLGLVRPDSGQALVHDLPYADARRAGVGVGAVLDTGFHPGRTALAHLRICCDALGLGERHALEALDAVDLGGQAKMKAKALSMGQRQRLALAAAVLGEPEVLVLDEPLNGLDPDGVRWLRRLLQDYARRGRTVLLSSHMLSELEQSVDDVVLIERRIVWTGTARQFLSTVEAGAVLATADDRHALELLDEAGCEAFVGPDGNGVRIPGRRVDDAEEVLAAAALPVYEREAFRPRFEDAMYACLAGTDRCAATEVSPAPERAVAGTRGAA